MEGLDRDTLIELKVVQKDDEENPTGITLPMTFTLGQLADWIAVENAE